MTTVQLAPGRLPKRLEAIEWAKPIFVRGAVPGDGPAVTIVGARAASGAAMARAGELARDLARRGFQIVSGGALGIDGAAHRGALAADGGKTTVVLGNGLDIAYPARHAPLFRAVLAHGGGLAGLVPDGTPPLPSLFPQRNPLIAALADAVVVVEADVRSGSLSTAHAGRRLGRIVAAYPGSRGCDRLLATGAALVEGVGDVELALAGTPRRPPQPQLDATAEQVRAAIAAGARGVDQIVHATGLTVRAVLRALPMLERYSS